MGNEWNNSALVTQFETMLRRRLRSGAAPVAACAGFDLDAASAYLEGALGGSHRAGYESHLAGCATCRRHLIELSRLARSASLAQAQPAVAPDRHSVWGRWKDAVAVRFDISSWNLKWQIAGATGAAFVILIAAYGAQSWRQASKQSNIAIAGQSAPSNMASLAESMGQSLPAPSVEVLPQSEEENAGASSDQNSIAPRREPLQALAPKPLVGPHANAPSFSVEASSVLMTAPSNLPVEELADVVKPNPMPSAFPQTGQSPAPRLGAIAETEKLAGARRPILSGSRNDSTEQVAARVTKDPVYEFRPSPPRGLNPMKSESPDAVPRRRGIGFLPGRQASPNSDPNFKPSDKSTSLIKEVWTGIKNRNPLKWPFNSESEQKPVPEAQDSSDDESSRAIVWRFRGKVFVFDKGTWIDQEYKPEMQEWRRWTLTRGSEQYKQVLTGEPQLKEFFDHGPILIVWKNQIYKVQK